MSTALKIMTQHGFASSAVHPLATWPRGDFPFCGVELQKHTLKYGLDFQFWLFAKFGHNHVFWF